MKPGRVEFTADKPFEHHLVKLELESQLGKGDIGQTSWLTLPLIVLIITLVMHWEKVGKNEKGFLEDFLTFVISLFRSTRSC